jgi:hypothetical protein
MILEFCRSCLQPELRRMGQREALRTLTPTSLDGGQMVFHLCGACRSRLTLADLEALRAQPDAWADVPVTVEVTAPDGGRRSDTVMLVEPRTQQQKARRRRRGARG